LPHGILPATLKAWLAKRAAGQSLIAEPVNAETMTHNPKTEHRSEAMQTLTAGITKAGTGIEGISWSILGQTYVPKTLSESSFSWHATFPTGTFVPPHIHPTQDEFIYLFEGRLDLVLDGKDFVAQAGDVIRLPMGIPHGIFNKTEQTVKCFFWVSPTRKLYDLFWAIHSMKEQKPEDVVALAARHEVMFLPPPPQ
jgi:quercetin dioxygenase-like cupin family protein